MVWLHWQQKAEQFLGSALLLVPFHILTITLLSLLLPLSFLLLSRLSSAQFLLSISSWATISSSSSFLFSFFLYTNPALLYALVSGISVATLVHGLTGNKISLVTESPGTVHRPRLYTAWILLCMLQVCVGLGIEGSIEARVVGFNVGIERSLFSRVIFFLGLHETMLVWSRTVVRPVVDDTIFGFTRDEKWIERAAMAVSLGSLWWWKLRDEVEALVIVAEVKKELPMGIGVADFVGWWLYYLMVTIGMVRVVKGLMWFGMILLCKRVRRNHTNSSDNDDKV